MASLSLPLILTLVLFFSACLPSAALFTLPGCHSFSCGNLSDVRFPFSNFSGRGCSLYQIKCNESVPKISVQGTDKNYIVKNISYDHQALLVQDIDISRSLRSNDCDCHRNFTLPVSGLLTFKLVTTLFSFFKCKKNLATPSYKFSGLQHYPNCRDYDLYYLEKNIEVENATYSVFLQECSVFELPLQLGEGSDSLLSGLESGFILVWESKQNCSNCYKKTGVCSGNAHEEWSKQVACFRSLSPAGRKGRGKLWAAAVGAIGGLMVCTFFYFLCSKIGKGKIIFTSVNTFPRNKYSRSALDTFGSSVFNTRVFPFKELQEATNNFDSSNELGSGGFGIVYYGMLRDGRSVAIKRLFESSCRGENQFMNEVEILSQLIHPNLVSLYGCTSRNSRELLLVYEFIPNGTLADHLQGERAKSRALTWPLRMHIAVETAEALAYLHAVEPPIIHRDIKSNNILLDENFGVKVADFGLSRLLPMDATHVSTTPQGTPGYVDPDYHKSYKLTVQSDVYSFGVVLVELISSKKAVDITRHRLEINLADMAVNKIRKQALEDLVDPCLGFETNNGVRMMVTLVAELAFRCLQEEKEVRPSMDEVLEVLKEIQSVQLGVITSD
ncbi:LEAF RUST 10 DISEASE-RESISTANCEUS RECEPTOR-LIKE PROTEIN KINASE-like 1.1 [Aristolochia californica]|uniref:LEAF RUST 10 DISEASE-RESISTANCEUS RECEPTOR-LIKE PROTEIN KINASE-like 1.1 n=1 Tax=Aristolochia californica TaxID=171875 RepID=UPI0035D82C8C